MNAEDPFGQKFEALLAEVEREECAPTGPDDTTPDALFHAKTRVERIVVPGPNGWKAEDDDVVKDPFEVEAERAAEPVETQPEEVDPVERADTVVPIHRERPVHIRLLNRVRDSALLQLLLLCFVGAGLVMFLLAPGGDEVAPRELGPPPTFPKLEIEGAPRVTASDIARQMRIADAKEIEQEKAAKPEVSFAELSTDEEKRAYLEAVAAEGRRKVLGEGGERLPGDVGRRRSFERELLREGRTGQDGATREVRKRNRQVFRWFTPGGTVKIEGAKEKKEKRFLPLKVGDRLFAKLEVGISSGHAAPVLARLSKPVEVGGRVVAPKGAMLKGRFRADALRIYATFDELILGTGERLFFEGFAIERKVPGLVGTRREIEGGEPGKAVLEETVDVAKEVVRSVTGGSIVGRVTEGVTEGVLPKAEAPQQATFILEVPAGRRFEIVLSKGVGS